MPVGTEGSRELLREMLVFIGTSSVTTTLLSPTTMITLTQKTSPASPMFTGAPKKLVGRHSQHPSQGKG